MSVPISVLLEVGALVKELYDRLKAKGKDEMTEEEWLELEKAVSDRRTKAWDSFLKSRNPLSGRGPTADRPDDTGEPEETSRF